MLVFVFVHVNTLFHEQISHLQSLLKFKEYIM